MLTGKGKLMSVVLPLLSLSLLAGAAVPADTRFMVRIGSHGPTTEVRVARPTLRWEIWPADGTSKVREVSLTLDGRRVEASYDPSARAVVHTPVSPLATGRHSVFCRITFENGATFTREWETRVADGPLTAFPAPAATQTGALRVANSYRKALGLPQFTADERLDYVAQLHSRYLTQNNAMGHGQIPGTPGFFGESGERRLASYGWIGASWEGVTFGAETPRLAVQDLFDAPYHRVPFLQPGPIAFGAGMDGRRTTLLFGANAATGTVVSPADGQQNVPLAWDKNERPNPLRVHRVKAPIGYPIVLAHFDPDVRRIKVTSATLQTEDGHAVGFFLNTPDNDDHLTNAAILMPSAPLRPATTYRVTFVGTDDKGRPISAQSQFRTAASR